MVLSTDAVVGEATSRVTWADVLWMAVFFGIVAGLVEAVVALFRMFALNRFVWLSRDLLWMAPLAAAMFALIPGLILAAVARYWRAVHIGWVVGLLAFCGIFALLLAVPRIAHYATAIVAAAVAFQLGLSAHRSPGAWFRVARRGSVVLARAAGTAALSRGARRDGSTLIPCLVRRSRRHYVCIRHRRSDRNRIGYACDILPPWRRLSHIDCLHPPFPAPQCRCYHA